MTDATGGMSTGNTAGKLADVGSVDLDAIQARIDRVPKMPPGVEKYVLLAALAQLDAPAMVDLLRELHALALKSCSGPHHQYLKQWRAEDDAKTAGGDQ